MTHIIQARFPSDAARLDALIREYAASLNFDICFQNLELELAELAARYGPPRGAAFIAAEGTADAGCIALRNLGSGICEMKRLYVRPAYRGTGLGRRLVVRLLDSAMALGYTAMRLDTVEPMMRPAVALYRSLGFVEIPAYEHHPVPGTIYMELPLTVARA